MGSLQDRVFPLMQTKHTGLIAAPFTPFQPTGEVHYDSIEQQAAALRQAGVAAAFVCGTTGEGMSLTGAERMQVAERWQKVNQLPVIVHVGHTCLSDCQALAAHAAKIGASATAAFAPFFFKPASVNDLVAFCAEIASAAPDLLFYFYHFPAITGVNFSMRTFLEVASTRIPNLAGIKYTHEDLLDFGRCLDFEGGRYEMLWGRDEALLAALTIGATGAVGSTYNYAAAPIYMPLLKAFAAGDLKEARRLQGKARDLIAIMVRLGGMSAGKAIMKIIGVDCGPVRPPLANLSSAQYAELEEKLKPLLQ